MSWDPVWEEIFRSREWGKYPPEELIRFTARNYYSAPDRRAVMLLELGCGAGANVWYLAKEGFQVSGIDGSTTAIDKASRRLKAEGLTADLRIGDIVTIADLYPANLFDAIIDVGCLMCNRLESVQATLDQGLALLKPGGKVLSMVSAQGSWGEGLGTEVETGTFLDIREGPLAGVGLVHFFTLEELQALYRRFDSVQIECSNRSMNNRQHWYNLWVVEATKPS